MKIDSKLGQVNEFSISHIDFSTIHLVLELGVSLIYPLDYSLISVRGWILFIFAKSKCYLCNLASLSSLVHNRRSEKNSWHLKYPVYMLYEYCPLAVFYDEHILSGFKLFTLV